MSISSENSAIRSSVPTPLGQDIVGEFTEFRGQQFYKIEHYDQMPEFFMSIVSAYDHWLFVASNGGLTAGRKNSDHALFPYYTEDKITDMAHCTGPLTLVRLDNELWRPFNPDPLTKQGQRSLYKSELGDQLYFVEDYLGLRFEYGWSFSERFGLVRTARLTNHSQQEIAVELLDGLQNILPANVGVDIQNESSVLLDAYKSIDCYENNVTAFSLSSQLTDLAEPSESLTTNVVWHTSLNSAFGAQVSLSEQAPKRFVQGLNLDLSERQRGQRGCYFLHNHLTLAPGQSSEWFIVAEVSQTGPDISRLVEQLKQRDLVSELETDLALANQTLRKHIAKNDGLQATADELTVVHHKANVLFNIMRGGFFEQGYTLSTEDIQRFVAVRQPALVNHAWWQTLPATLTVQTLEAALSDCDSLSLKRLVREYLPISFSRRHGDPSRPWNKFSINLKDSSGQAIKNYQGNWRDIFQNWEPLAYSYPKFLPAMMSAFLNATTADGYNPYRVTRAGIEWEEPEEGNSWANIGYWSDHQIIYLSKLLELQMQIDPQWLADSFNQARYSFAQVPYRIKPFAELRQNPYDSIEFDHELNDKLQQKVTQFGTDAKLLMTDDQFVVHVNLVEKLLTLWLAKLSNFVPDGGVWMNTQRPEWNDANNALVGWGLSVVTTNYLYRHLTFMRAVLLKLTGDVLISQPLLTWLKDVQHVFKTQGKRSGEARFDAMSQLSLAADDYRLGLYQQGWSTAQGRISVADLVEFLDDVLPTIKQTIASNRRADGLYHCYNLLHLNNNQAEVEHLPLMLEGQVAVLSSNSLSPDEALAVLTALRKSDLYRADQHTYLLYPNKVLPTFVSKNQISQQALAQLDDILPLLKEAGLVYQSADQQHHFAVTLANAKVLNTQLVELTLTADQHNSVLAIYEQTFQHKSFTGRSGSFFAYEGLGSTYWHMVSKLLLAAQENWQQAQQRNLPSADALKACYYDIRAGIGFNKTPAQYGAFPTDPYSHTPETGIARQPGMTGQVKEEILTRFGEMGLQWRHGCLTIQTGLLRASEFLTQGGEFQYLDLNGQMQALKLAEKSLAFSVAQVPFIYHQAAPNEVLSVTIYWQDDEPQTINDGQLPLDASQSIMAREGRIDKVEVVFPVDNNLSAG